MTGAMLYPNEICAVVVGADACGLGIVRSLGQQGVPVVIVDHDPGRPAMVSRYARPVVASAIHGLGLVDSLLSLRTRLTCQPVLFLTSDMQVQTVSDHRHRLAPIFRIPLPCNRTVRELLHKPSFQRIAETLGFSVPISVVIHCQDDLGKLAKIQYPAVIKPATKEGSSTTSVPRARHVSGLDEAVAVCRAALTEIQDIIVQEWVEGEESDIYFCLQYRGENIGTISSFTGRKIRCWPPQIGSTASCMPAPEVGEILEPLTTAFFDRTRFVGLCSMEFKRDCRSGTFFMIEPTVGRADWQEEVATLNGVNLPLAAFRHQIGLPLPPDRSTRSPVVWRDPACYWRSVIAARSFRDQTPSGVSVKSSCWRANDPAPLLLSWREWLKKGWAPSRWRARPSPDTPFNRLGARELLRK